MIYNRTIEDVQNAIKIREEKIKKFEQLTDDEIDILEKGFVTINTLNRIENSQYELQSSLKNMGYHDNNFVSKEWLLGGVFYSDDLIRIFENAKKLKKSFFSYETTPNVNAAKYDYNEFNSIEKIIYDLFLMVEEVKQNYIECGDYKCGGN